MISCVRPTANEGMTRLPCVARVRAKAAKPAPEPAAAQADPEPQRDPDTGEVLPPELQ